MSKRTVMLLLAFLCAAAGFIMANNILGTRLHTVSVSAADEFYAAPSVTAARCSAFSAGEELTVLEQVVMEAPTAVIMQDNLLAEDESKTKYKLVKGAAYQIEDPQLQKANSPCLIKVQTTGGKQAVLSVPKAAVKPVDEGTWLRVRSTKSGEEGWLLSKTQWY